jgi:hypothetical protein
MQVLDWNTFTAAEWSTMTEWQWHTFLAGQLENWIVQSADAFTPEVQAMSAESIASAEAYSPTITGDSK